MASLKDLASRVGNFLFSATPVGQAYNATQTAVPKIQPYIPQATNFIQKNPVPNLFANQQFQQRIAQPIVQKAYNTPVLPFIPVTPKSYIQGQVINPIKQGVQQIQKPGLFNKGLGAMQLFGGASAVTPYGALSNIAQGAIGGVGQSIRERKNPLTTIAQGINTPTSVATTGLGITNPYMALAVDVLSPSVANKGVKIAQAKGLINVPGLSKIEGALADSKGFFDNVASTFQSGVSGSDRKKAIAELAQEAKRHAAIFEMSPKEIERSVIASPEAWVKKLQEKATLFLADRARATSYGLKTNLYGGKSATGFKNEGSFSSMADKKVRFEIDDSRAKVISPSEYIDKLPYAEKLKRLGSGQGVTVGEILDHPELYKNYPNVKNIKVVERGLDSFANGTRASFDPSTNTITLNTDRVGKKLSEQDKSTLLHEIQHAIQEKEGFARGGSPQASSEEFLLNLRREKLKPIEARATELYNKKKTIGWDIKDEQEYEQLGRLKDKIWKETHSTSYANGIDLYKRLSGEVEARDVQSRMNLPPEQRASTLPYQSQNIPVKDQIVRFDGGVSASKVENNANSPENIKWFSGLQDDMEKLNRGKFIESLPRDKTGKLTIDPEKEISKMLDGFNKKYGTQITTEDFINGNLPERNDLLLKRLGYVEPKPSTGGEIGKPFNPEVTKKLSKNINKADAKFGDNSHIELIGKDPNTLPPDKQPNVVSYEDHRINKTQDGIDVVGEVIGNRHRNGDVVMYTVDKPSSGEIPKGKAQQPIKVPEQPRGFTESVQQAENIPKRVKGMVQSVYVSKPNSKLMGEAQALLQEGASLDITKVQNVDQKIAATIQEAINQQRKNPDLAANLYNNLARQGTELGRGVQAYSLLQKMTPEAIAKSAAGKIQEYNRTAVRKIPELTGDQLKLITAKVDAIKKLPIGSRERNIAVNELSNVVNSFIPSSVADKAITVWKAGLLTSLRTTERNLFGNTIHGAAEAIKDVPATFADMLMGLATKKRTITITGRGTSEAWSKKTAQQISDTIKLGYDATEDISKYDIKRVNWGNTPIQQALKKYTDIVFRSLGAQDKPFYNAAFKRSLFSQAGAEAINAGRSGDRAFIQNLVNNPTDDMIKLAMGDANVATFKDKNSASVVANAIKRELEKVKIGEFEVGKIASEITMPFTGVPSAILGQIINYSPFGLLKGIVNTGKVIASQVPDLQRQAAQEIGRGVIGTGIFGLGAYLASKGLITGQPKDAEEQRQWDLENKPRNSIMIGGKWRSLNSIGPEAVVFLAGSKLNEEMKNPEGSVGGYAGTLAKDYLDQSFVQGLQQPVNVITDPGRYGKGYAGGMVSSVVPNIVKDLSKATDTSQRETNTVGDYFKAAIPGKYGRQSLIEKRDVLGNVMKQEPTGLGAFFDLFNSKTPIDNAVVSELSRLQKEGEGATPSKLTPQQTILKEKVKLTFDQLNQLEKGVGEALRPQLQDLVTSQNYAQLTDEQKAQAIDKIVKETRNKYKNINAGAITGNEQPKSIEGQMIPIVNKNGNVTMIDTSFQPTKPQLTGKEELDKKAISKFNGEITQKANDIYDLYKAGKLTEDQANTELLKLKELKASTGKGRSLKNVSFKAPKVKSIKISMPKKRTIKALKLPKLKAPMKSKKNTIKITKVKPITFKKLSGLTSGTKLV